LYLLVVFSQAKGEPRNTSTALDNLWKNKSPPHYFLVPLSLPSEAGATQNSLKSQNLRGYVQSVQRFQADSAGGNTQPHYFLQEVEETLCFHVVLVPGSDMPNPLIFC